jgi:catalase
MMKRTTTTLLAVATLLGAAATPVFAVDLPGESAASRTPLPAQLVKDLHSAFGDNHARAVHAKGIILQGKFEPSVEAKTLSRAAVFDVPVPILVRFSDFTGIPNIPDNTYDASPRGLSIKFNMPDGSNLDIVNHGFNGFPVATAAEFGLLFRAIAASGPNAAKPSALDSFLAAHPIAKTFLTSQKPPPESYATAAYYGVNAFMFTDASGISRPVRYRFIPEAGEHYLDDALMKKKSADFLSREIEQRITGKPVRFIWYAQIAEPGDKIEDPSIAWPESRRLVALGVLTIDRIASNTPQDDKALQFLPGTLLPGIGIADPMVTVRNAAYPVSAEGRQ